MIYIHIPFCRHICNYCDFHHSASLLHQSEMLGAIEAELVRRKDCISHTKTLYFGGGTPSVCSPEQIKRHVDLVRQLWKVNHFEEVTLEANPEDLTPEYLERILAAGVNRLSIGIQSFVDDHLQKMNRHHTARQAIQAVEDAKQAGFNNITIDLMYGLPWLTVAQWEANIETAISLDIQHISAYHLTIEPKTILGKQRIKAVDDQVSELHFEMLHGRLTDAGYEHYEVSNFARRGFRAVHNSGYWQGVPYLGVGPSAHSYDGQGSRHWNVSSNKLYLDGDLGQQEMLTPTDLHNEYLMTRLRTADGFRVSEYEERFGTKLQPTEGLILNGDRAMISPRNFLISDSVISSLFRV